MVIKHQRPQISQPPTFLDSFFYFLCFDLPWSFFSLVSSSSVSSLLPYPASFSLYVLLSFHFPLIILFFFYPCVLWSGISSLPLPPSPLCSFSSTFFSFSSIPHPLLTFLSSFYFPLLSPATPMIPFLFLLSILSFHSALFTSSLSAIHLLHPSSPTGYNLKCACVLVYPPLSPSLYPSEPHVLSYYSLIISEPRANPQHSYTHIFLRTLQVRISTWMRSENFFYLFIIFIKKDLFIYLWETNGTNYQKQIILPSSSFMCLICRYISLSDDLIRKISFSCLRHMIWWMWLQFDRLHLIYWSILQWQAIERLSFQISYYHDIFSCLNVSDIIFTFFDNIKMV